MCPIPSRRAARSCIPPDARRCERLRGRSTRRRPAGSTASTAWWSSAATAPTGEPSASPIRASTSSAFPGTIDLDISCTEYTIGFDTSVNTAMEAIDKVRDTSTSHERCSIIEVMGRNAGYLALWCGIANGAEDILLPEKYDYDEQKIIDNIIDSRRRGKKHHIIVNAEGIGHSASMARRIEAATGIDTRATILGHMQRGGSPTAKDRVYASIMGCMAVDLLIEGKSERVVGYKNGKFQDFDIDEALAMVKGIDDYQYEIATAMSGGYHKEKKAEGSGSHCKAPQSAE